MSPKDEPQDAPRRRTQKNDATPQGLNPSWWMPVALGLMIAGLLWVMTYYISSGDYPIPGIDAYNIAIGFVGIMAGFVMLTRWK